jgi:hypothetical protein
MRDSHIYSGGAAVTALRGEMANTSWEETTYAEREGDRKLTRAAVTQDLSGDIAGRGQVEWLMSYADDGTAHFVGLQSFEGVIEGREGSVVLETIGDFDGNEATWVGKVVEGSGTGDWSVARGRPGTCWARWRLRSRTDSRLPSPMHRACPRTTPWRSLRSTTSSTRRGSICSLGSWA